MATTTVIRTPDRNSRPTFLRRPMIVADPGASDPSKDCIHRSSPSPTPLRRRTNGDRDLHSPVRSVERIALSFGHRPSLQRTNSSSSDQSSAIASQPRRPLEQSQTRLPRVSNSSLPLPDASTRTPSTRPSQLSLQDLNAPKPKRRSIEFGQSPLPRLVLTPPDAKSKTRISQGRLPAPIFTNSKAPLLRRASSSPPTTPSTHNEDWLTNLSKYSDSMTKLSLHESDGPHHDSSPLGGSLRVPLDRSLKLAKAPSASHLRHRRARSGEVKSIKRLSLGRIPDDVFDATSSSSPSRAVTPSQDGFKVHRPLVWQADAGTPFTQQHPGLDGSSSLKPRSESLPDFFMPSERGIAQKRSNIGNTSVGSRPKALKSKVSRPSERDKPQTQDSSISGFSFEGELDDVGDSSFTSITSLGSPVVKTSECFPTNFLADLDDPVIINPSFPVPDVPLVTPGFEPSSNSRWPGAPDVGLPVLDSDGEESREIDVDSILFNSMQAKQAGRSSLPGPLAKPMMPDTPVKHPGRLGLSVQRAWQSTTKLIQTNKTKPLRKSLPLKFSPFPNQSKKHFDSPDSDCSEFSPNLSNPSPSPSLRNHVSMVAPRKSYGLNVPIGLGRPTSTQARIPISNSSPTMTQPKGLFGTMSMIPKSTSVKTDLLNNMGIDKNKADLLRRTSSSAWSFSSESSSEGAGTPSRDSMRLEDWRFPSPSTDNGHVKKLVHRKSVTFIDSSPLTRRSSGAAFHRLPSPARDTIMSSANSSPSAPFPSPFDRPLSPLPTSPYWNDSDDDDCEEDVVLDFGIKEEPRWFESQFVCEEGLGAGSFGQAFRVMLRQNSSSGTSKAGGKLKPKFYAIKKSKRYEGAKHRLRLLEEFDILRHLAGDTTSRRSRSMSLSYSASAPSETPNVNVLQFIHGWEQDSMLCIQTELCELGNLSDFLFEFGAKFNRLDEPRIWKIMSEVGNGLLHIHHQNVIHLDLKPANIFITLEGRLRIGDFGMASRWPRPASFGDGNEGFDREGDREYMAPEILKGKYGREADIFSFGMIMLECAGNIVVPDMGDPWHRLRSQDFSDIDLSGLTPTLIDLIMRLMSPEPADRPLIDQVCAHDVVMKTRSTMLRNIEAVRRASITLIINAAPAEIEAAREEAQIALFKASALGTEDGTFLGEVFSESAEERHPECEPMDLTP